MRTMRTRLPRAWCLLLLAPLAFALAATCDSPTGNAKALYIALGDSLSEGVGASDASTTAFVPLVHQHLGDGYELHNLGHSGDTSQQLLDNGHVDDAVAEIQARNGDADPNNDVKLVTLEIGGNDLLHLYFSLVLTGVCRDVDSSITNPQCTQPLRDTLDTFDVNLKKALDNLQAADPALRILVLTLYNPFGGVGPVGALSDLSLEGMPDTPFPEGVNDIIRRQAGDHSATLVDVYPLFQGRAADLISGDSIHPNDDGYRVMADAVIAALNKMTS